MDWKKYLSADIPLLLWGPPGTGKTSVVEAEAIQNDVHIETIIGSTMDPTDLGRPFLKGDDVAIAPPPWAKRIKEALDSGNEAWLFLDELTCAPPSIQAAMLRVVNERKVAELDLTGMKIVAASNPQSQSADGIDLSAAMANRWAHIDWTLDHNEWIAGEIGGWGKPDQKLAAARGVVTGWIGKNPSALLAPPEDNEDNIQAWASPRSWSNTIRLLGEMDLNTSNIRSAVATLCGNAAAIELAAWYADNDLPSAQDLLSGKVSLPQRGDIAHMCLKNTLSLAIASDQLMQFWTLLKTARKDIRVLNVKAAINAIQKSGIADYRNSDLDQMVDEFVAMQ